MTRAMSGCTRSDSESAKNANGYRGGDGRDRFQQTEMSGLEADRGDQQAKQSWLPNYGRKIADPKPSICAK